jgi:hypothetical protein
MHNFQNGKAHSRTGHAFEPVEPAPQGHDSPPSVSRMMAAAVLASPRRSARQ